MKKRSLTLSAILILLLSMVTFIASAQVTAGPSDATTAPPATASAVAKVVCYGSTISLSGPQDNGVDFAKYHWYKVDPNGVRQEDTNQTGRTYTETSGAAGYYTYQVVTENANGCTSPLSDPLQIYVLPQLSVNITTPTSSMCAVATNSTVLTANVTPSTGYTINYQWTRNGTDISGATSSTYTVTNETTAATVTFGVKTSYALNSTCAATNTKDIVITPLPTKPAITAN
ncbi:hypothetical protein [Mucilaginibacter sp. UYCu711]|uniref:hypothetical protein n=1 Tax=Mucilaginibacter sp. UYCu711 TaxID=3156339 RepID=UPI003D1F3B34